MKPMLKRFLPRLLFVLTLLASSGMNRSAGLMAQDTIGFARSGWSGMPPSVYSGTLVTAGAFVKNLSFSAYPESDTIQIAGYIDTLGPSVIPFITPPLDSVHLYAQDS